MHELKEFIIQICNPFLDWCTSLGEWGLFSLAFVEAAFFPIPPDFLYITMILKGAENPYMLALIASIGSALGAYLGYAIGIWGGRPIAQKVLGKHADGLLTKAENFFKEYGSVAILIAAFTPIPFKVFTVAGGISRMNLVSFGLFSLLGRSGRFFAFTYLMVNYGQAIIDNFFKLSLIAALVGLILFFLIKWKNSSSKV